MNARLAPPGGNRYETLRRLIPGRFVLLLCVTSLLELFAYRRMRDAAGVPSAPLDDVFIHLEYARSIAEGHAFRYGSPDVPASSGATSILYAYLLAIPYALGLRGLSLLIAAHAYCAIAWALLAESAARLGALAWDRSFSVFAALACVLHAGLTWAAGSGMETILSVATAVGVVTLSVALTRDRSRRTAIALACIGAIAPFVRPELSAWSLLASGTILLCAPGRLRALGVVPFAGVMGVPFFWWVVTGSARSSGALAKWMPYDPYATPADILEHVKLAVVYQVEEVLGGEDWSVRYHPHGLVPLAALGYVSVVTRALLRRRFVEALIYVGTLVLFVVPATFVYFDTHRMRYLWATVTIPVLFAFVPLLAVGAHPEGTEMPRARTVVAVTLASLLLAAFASRVPAAFDDLAECAAAIHAQQMDGAMTVLRPLPRDATILINDAGAASYFGGHRTLDFVGLTSMPFAGALSQGAGTVFETLEALPREQWPSHAWLYRSWLHSDGILGPTLASRYVAQQSILGGPTMELARVRHEVLRSGDVPLEAIRADEQVVDDVDVADLVSERAHAYDDLDDDASKNLVRVYPTHGRSVADGGRVVDRSEHFRVRAIAGGDARLLLRTDAYFPAVIRLTWNGRALPDVALEESRTFVDLPIAIPGDIVRESNEVRVDLVRGPNFGSFHYFLVQRPAVH